MAKHEHLVCRICGTDIEVPLCCEKDMAIADGMLICNLCGSEKEIPLCCGKDMKIVA